MEVKKDEEMAYERDLDMAGAGREVWLIKVPKYISDRWDKCPEDVVAGHLDITEYYLTISLILLLVKRLI